MATITAVKKIIVLASSEKYPVVRLLSSLIGDENGDSLLL
jgi:hypothetical protein